MAEDSGAPPGYPPPATLYKAAAGCAVAAAVFLVAIVLLYASEAGHLHGATWLGFALGLVLAAVLAGFAVIQIRLRRERRRRSAIGGWLTLAGVICVLGAGSVSSHANATYGGALLVAGLGICLGLGGAAFWFARHPAAEPE